MEHLGDLLHASFEELQLRTASDDRPPQYAARWGGAFAERERFARLAAPGDALCGGAEPLRGVLLEFDEITAPASKTAAAWAGRIAVVPLIVNWNSGPRLLFAADGVSRAVPVPLRLDDGTALSQARLGERHAFSVSVVLRRGTRGRVLEQALPFDFAGGVVCDSLRANTDAVCHERRAHTFMLALTPATGDVPPRVLVRMLCQMPVGEFDKLDSALREVQDNVNSDFIEAAQLDAERAYWPVQMAAKLDLPITYWTHFLVSHDGKLLSLYINGSHAVSTATPGPWAYAEHLPLFTAGAAGTADNGSLAPSTFDAFDGEIKALSLRSESFDREQASEQSHQRLGFERIDDEQVLTTSSAKETSSALTASSAPMVSFVTGVRSNVQSSEQVVTTSSAKDTSSALIASSTPTVSFATNVQSNVQSGNRGPNSDDGTKLDTIGVVNDKVGPSPDEISNAFIFGMIGAVVVVLCICIAVCVMVLKQKSNSDKSIMIELQRGDGRAQQSIAGAEPPFVVVDESQSKIVGQVPIEYEQLPISTQDNCDSNSPTAAPVPGRDSQYTATAVRGTTGSTQQVSGDSTLQLRERGYVSISGVQRKQYGQRPIGKNDDHYEELADLK